MFEFIEPHISEAISFLAGATCGSLLTLRITRRQRLSNSTIADQRGVQAEGDVVGRDKLTGAAARPGRKV
jgi:hypothetical protein